jgi:nucleotide-binding universal stress UspA family protein
VDTNQPASQVARQRIVVGVDGSPQSEQALHWAAYLADSTGSEIEAVIAWPPVVMWGTGWTPGIPDWNPVEDSAKQLESSLERVFGNPIPASVHQRVVEGGAAQALIDASRDAIALVVGSRGHGGFTGMLLGSVSAACAEHASCPVLVVHGDNLPPKR